MAYGFLGVVLIVLAVASLLLAHFFFPGHFLKLKPQEPVVRDSFDPLKQVFLPEPLTRQVVSCYRFVKDTKHHRPYLELTYGQAHRNVTLLILFYDAHGYPLNWVKALVDDTSLAASAYVPAPKKAYSASVKALEAQDQESYLTLDYGSLIRLSLVLGLITFGLALVILMGVMLTLKQALFYAVFVSNWAWELGLGLLLAFVDGAIVFGFFAYKERPYLKANSDE
jgi:uncharacterized integral membrane protein